MVESQLTSVSLTLAEKSSHRVAEDSDLPLEPLAFEKISKTIVRLIGQQVLREVLSIPDASPAIVSNFEQLVTIVQELRSLVDAQSNHLATDPPAALLASPDELALYVADEAHEVLAALKDHAAQVTYLSVGKQFFLQRYLPIEKLMPRLVWYVARSHYDHMQLLGGIPAKVSWDQENWQTGVLRLVPLLVAIAPDLHWQLDLVLNKPPQATLAGSALIQRVVRDDQPVLAEQLLTQVTHEILATTLEVGIFLEPMDVEFLEPGKNWQAGSLKIQFDLAFIPSPPDIPAPSAPIASELNPENLEDLAEDPIAEDAIDPKTTPTVCETLPFNLPSCTDETITQHFDKDPDLVSPSVQSVDEDLLGPDDVSPELSMSDPEAIAALVDVIEAQTESFDLQTLNTDIEDDTISTLNNFLDVQEPNETLPTPPTSTFTLEVFQAELQADFVDSTPIVDVAHQPDQFPEPTLALFQAELTAVLDSQPMPNTATFAEIMIPPLPQTAMEIVAPEVDADDTPTLAIFEQELSDVLSKPFAPKPSFTQDDHSPGEPSDRLMPSFNASIDVPDNLSEECHRAVEDKEAEWQPALEEELLAVSDAESQLVAKAETQTSLDEQPFGLNQPDPILSDPALLDPTLKVAFVDEISSSQLVRVETRQAIIQALISLQDIYRSYRQTDDRNSGNGLSSPDEHITALVKLVFQVITASQLRIQHRETDLKTDPILLAEWTSKLFWQITRSSYELMQLVRGVPANVLQPDRGWQTGTLQLLTILQLKDGEQNWAINLAHGNLHSDQNSLNAGVIVQSDAVDLLQEPTQGQELITILCDRLKMESALLQGLMETTQIKIFSDLEPSDPDLNGNPSFLKLDFALELHSART